MRFLAVLGLILTAGSASADYRITRDHGGELEKYKARYASLRDKGERVIIDGICNSACSVVLGLVPLNRVCVTPRASLGLHQAYYDKRYTFGVKVISARGTAELMSYYPQSVKDWLRRHGQLFFTDDAGIVGLRHGNPHHTQGSSGGAWVGLFNTGTADKSNFVISVSSFNYAKDPSTAYGPYWDDGFTSLLADVSKGC